MPAAKKSSPKKKGKKPSFEDALAELEDMVETMESGQLPLEKLIASYERGAALISHCESVLGEARQRLELITLQPKASDQSEPSNLTHQEDAQEGTSPSTDSNDDEIRLF
ncbi:MAG: exodeoxyribonuclease VII small subunit [Verrucomicrobiae bacterium]|nr:exodeoxyribonuclease VII small subunit [Verrucomicrobiae bacterium]NNJ86656.1 exodeoxyribonuclease VII small subunit [Akkermansiaceae bacterium]